MQTTVYGTDNTGALDPTVANAITSLGIGQGVTLGDGNSIVEFIESFCLRVASPSLVDTVEFFVVTLSVHLSPRDSA